MARFNFNITGPDNNGIGFDVDQMPDDLTAAEVKDIANRLLGSKLVQRYLGPTAALDQYAGISVVNSTSINFQATS